MCRGPSSKAPAISGRGANRHRLLSSARETGAAESVREDLEVLADVLAAGSSEDWDEIDVLFRGGR